MNINLVEYNMKIVNGDKYERSIYETGVYQVTRDVTTYAGHEPLVRFYVEAMDREDCYFPQIYFNDDFFGEREPRFEVQTTSFGALAVDEFEVFVEAQQVGLETARALEAYFFG